jgi:hypothetical protein
MAARHDRHDPVAKVHLDPDNRTPTADAGAPVAGWATG